MMDEQPELLFFDTFSHELQEKLNLDLVQFPQPVFISEIRIIPLGARVQSDFPGGFPRLGATNPSSFHVDFFVNDLSTQSSAFEFLGAFEYNQNDSIHMPSSRKIVTDGLVLKGFYTTITLAVYGSITKNLAETFLPEQEALPPPTAAPPQAVTTATPASESEELSVPQPVVDKIQDEEIWPEDGHPPPPPSLPSLQPIPSAAAAAAATAAEIEAGSGGKVIIVDNSETQSSAIYPVADAPKDPRIHTQRRRSTLRTRSNSGDKDSAGSAKEKDHRGRRREWSRSPEYYHRHGTPSSESRRRPRTPSDLTGRPRSPSCHSHEEEANVEAKGILSVRSPTPASAADTKVTLCSVAAASAPTTAPSSSLDEDFGSPNEQFELIESDEDIGEDGEQWEVLDYDQPLFEVINAFNPQTTTLQRYRPVDGSGKSIPTEREKAATKYFETLRKCLSKFRAKTALRFETFLDCSSDERESFVQYAEQVVQCLAQFSAIDHEATDKIVEQFIQEGSDELNTLFNYLRIGLSFEMAVSQKLAVYKIRHMKVGIRLVELICSYSAFAGFVLIEKQLNLYDLLLGLFSQHYMALSIRLMILRALYSALASPLSVEYFLSDNNTTNGYRTLLLLLSENPSGRAAVALKSLTKKLNIYESLLVIQSTVKKIFNSDPTDVEVLQEALAEVIKFLTNDTFGYSQPKRFLPVAVQFEIAKDAVSFPFAINGIRAYMKSTALLESLNLLIAGRNKIPTRLFSMAHKLAECILRIPKGLDYLAENIDQTNLLMKELLQLNGYVESETGDDSTVLTSPNYTPSNRAFGVELAYKMQTKYYLDGIADSTTDEILMNNLQSLYTLCFNPGREYVVATMCANDHLAHLLHLIESEKQTCKNGSPNVKNKSPILIYAVDLLDFCIRNSSNIAYLDEHGHVLQLLVKQHEAFEPSVSAILQEMAVYLKPLEISTSVSGLSDVTQLLDLMKRSIEFITTYPGDLIMALRILRHNGIAWYDNDNDGGTFEKGAEYRELRYKHFLIQVYSADGVSLLLSILEKLNTYFQQPGMHSASLASSQGVLLTQIILPTVELLRRILMLVIEARNTDFKDLTAIEPILRTFALVHCIPERGFAHNEARKIQEEIAKILLVFTQPQSVDGLDTQTVYKSLWTLMLQEVIKFILSGPHSFLPGLLVFSELLPLPLPIPSRKPLDPSEIQQMVTLRQLWSAHLHSQSNSLTEMIQTICTSSNPEVLLILCRVCLQLSDLAPNMTLLVAKAITELLLSEPLKQSGVATAQHVRLFAFMANMVSYPSTKVSFLSILANGKLIELIDAILTASDESEAHLHVQESIHSVIQNLLDVDVTMVVATPSDNYGSALACALPSKELILSIASSTIVNVLVSVKARVCAAAMRTLLMFTDHDITLKCLLLALRKKDRILEEISSNLLKRLRDNEHEFRPICSLFIEFIYNLLTPDSIHEFKNVVPRTFSLSAAEVSTFLGWPSGEEDCKQHAFTQILNHIQAKSGSEETKVESKSEKYDEIFELHRQRILKSFNDITEQVEVTPMEIDLSTFPQAEGIVTQFSSRQVFYIGEDVEDALTAAHWLNVPLVVDEENSAERVTCDLYELIQTCLPAETNLTSDCKRLLHLSASPQSNRDRQMAAHCFRTRRVDIDSTTGRPEKRVYASSIRSRGYSRAAQSRGDLFRSRPPNTSRPPSLHVDDFLALETCGAQPTGPTGYNKLSREIIIHSRSSGRRGRGRSSAKHWQRESYYAHFGTGPPPSRRGRGGLSRYLRSYPR